MERTINERINTYLKDKRLTIRSLSQSLNIKESTLGNKLSGRFRIDTDTVVAILKAYPELSADWLLLGSGPMLRAHEYYNEPVSLQFNDDGDNISGYGNTVNKNNTRVVELLEKQLEEEKARNREYWNTIQQLIKK